MKMVKICVLAAIGLFLLSSIGCKVVKPYSSLDDACESSVSLFNLSSTNFVAIQVTAGPNTQIVYSEVPASWSQLPSYPQQVYWFPPNPPGGVPTGFPLAGDYKVWAKATGNATPTVQVRWLNADNEAVCEETVTLECGSNDTGLPQEELAKVFQNRVSFDEKNGILAFHGKRSFVQVYELITDNNSLWEESLHEDSLPYRPTIYTYFESLFPGYESLGKVLAAQEMEADRAGKEEPATGYAFYEGFLDDDLNVLISKKRAVRIGHSVYRFTDPHTMWELYAPKGQTEAVSRFLNIEDPEQLKLPGLSVHFLQDGTVLHKDRNQWVAEPGQPGKGDEKDPCEFVGVTSGSLEPTEKMDADDCEVSLTINLIGCNQYLFIPTATVDNAPPPSSVSYSFELFRLDPNSSSPVLVSSTNGNTPWTQTLATGGEYLIRFTMSGGPCEDPAIAEEQFSFMPLQVDFTYDDKPCEITKLDFEPQVQLNSSFGEVIIGYEWTFFDAGGSPLTPASSTLQNPTYDFTALGTYKVCLKVTTNTNCTVEECKYIEISNSCKPEFSQTFSVCSEKDCGGVSVEFHNESEGGVCPITFTWDFGDGQSTTQVYNQTTSDPDPVHVYENCGRYTVRLTMEDALGCEEVVVHTIDLNPMNLDFTWQICPNGRVRFEANQPRNCEVLGLFNCYPQWDFGGGDDTWYKAFNLLYPRRPIAFYDTPNNYNVSMTYQNEDGNRCTITKTLPITEYECCAKNDRAVRIENWGSDHRAKAVFVQTQVLWVHQVKAKTILKKKKFGIYWRKKAEEIKAGWQGGLFFANGSWWQINVERTRCNCVTQQNYTLSANTDTRTNSSKAKQVTGFGLGGNFATRQGSIQSYHYIERKDGSTRTMAPLILGIDCDDNN